MNTAKVRCPYCDTKYPVETNCTPEQCEMRPKSLVRFQEEIREWSDKNFGENANAFNAFMGMVEEMGELSHALLKRNQGIRHTPEEIDALVKDAVADILIFTLNFCSYSNISAQDVLELTWNRVKQRDWTKNKMEG